MKIQIISLFPEMLEPVFAHSMMRKAREQDHLDFSVVNLRDFGEGERKTVDDAPYGGGDGMLLKVAPLHAAIEHARAQAKNAGFAESAVLLMTPKGRRFDQAYAKELAAQPEDKSYIFVCGRYEGYDERVLQWIDQEVSVGDYVLTGGELPAMTIADAIVRLIPGVLGGEQSAEIESFSDGKTLEFPQYTRPEMYEGMQVPPVLLSGNHAEIEAWRQANSKQVEA